MSAAVSFKAALFPSETWLGIKRIWLQRRKQNENVGTTSVMGIKAREIFCEKGCVNLYQGFYNRLSR